jgi:hypothetical protein
MDTRQSQAERQQAELDAAKETIMEQRKIIEEGENQRAELMEKLQILMERVELIDARQREAPGPTQPPRDNNRRFTTSAPPQIPIFDGKKTHEDARSFLEKMQLSEGEHSDSELATRMRLHLSGEAESWFRDLPAATKASFQLLAPAFETRFLNPDNHWIIDKEIRSRRQQDTESVDDYLTDLTRLWQQTDRTAAVKLQDFLGGLRMDIDAGVRKDNLKDLESAIRAARHAERLQQVTARIAIRQQDPTANQVAALQTSTLDDLMAC